jgi:glycosyltransferase involved in cell wall biosynthesis
MGGSQYQARLLIERLLQRGDHDVHYVTRRAAPGYRPAGYQIHRIGRGRRLAGTFVQDAPELWRLLASLQPDVVYQRVGCAYTGVAAHYCRHRGARMVWHVALDTDVTPRRIQASPRAPLLWLEQRCLAYGVRNADAIVVQNLGQGEALRRHYGREYTAHIPNFHPLPPADLAKPESPVTVCWVANLKPSKRPHLFLRLASALAAVPGVEWVMAGSRPTDPAELEEFERQLAAAPNVRYVGALAQEDVNSLLERSHVFVNTSAREGFANTFIQCWLRRVLVVSLSVNPDGMFDGDRYGLSAGDDFERLETQTLRAIQDARLRESVGAAALDYARERFSERNIDQLIDLLSPPAVR